MLRYHSSMPTETLKSIVEHAQSWPREDQEELADYARVIQARRRDHYVLTDAERAAVAEGIAQADRSEFVSDDQVAAVDKRRGI